MPNLCDERGRLTYVYELARISDLRNTTYEFWVDDSFADAVEVQLVNAIRSRGGRTQPVVKVKKNRGSGFFNTMVKRVVLVGLAATAANKFRDEF